MAIDSPGRLIFPVPFDTNIDVSNVKEMSAVAGCNLLTETPEIADWLSSSNFDEFIGMTLGSYAYLDGAMFVLITIAQDAIVTKVCHNRQQANKHVSLAYLCTPTDVFLRPLHAREEALQRWKDRPYWMHVSPVPKKNIIYEVPLVNENGIEFDIVDCTVHEQGPNYLLAKRIQHWRAIVAREVHQLPVSSNVAPASFTISVTKVALLHAAYIGTTTFEPIEIFQPETSNNVMAAALLYDIFFQKSAAHPTTPLDNPLSLFSKNCWHGGMWTSAVYIRTAVVPAAVIGLAKQYGSYVMAAGGVAGMAAWAGIRKVSKL